MNLLDGVRILELGSYITAPYCGMMLADLGADVIKVENPNGGDPFRSFRGGSYSPHFIAFNKNKRSVTLDLTTADGSEALYALIDEADVLLENFRPGVVDRLGLGWDALHQRNPRLVHCSITGFGTIGPYRDRPAYDTVVSSLSGFLGSSLDLEQPVLAGTTVADNVAGLTACYAILAALFERSGTNVGRRIEIDMLEALIAFSPGEFASLGRVGVVSNRFTRASASQSWTLRCADGKVLAVHLSSPEKFWDAALLAFDCPELARDPRFATRMQRVANYLELGAELQRLAGKQPRSYWIGRLEEFEVPFAPVYRSDEVLADPQVNALGTFFRTRHPSEGEVLLVRRPVYIDGERPMDDSAPPILGEHNDEILGKSGTWPASKNRTV